MSKQTGAVDIGVIAARLTDINECATRNGGCDDRCEDRFPDRMNTTHECFCDTDGFELNPDNMLSCQGS